MRYLSVCSGIEAATVAWHPLGWQPVAFSEIEPFPSAVLAHHYPAVPNVGDMTKYKEWDLGAVDLLVGGTPCQSFSVAGLRRGLADPRGNLALVYCGILDFYRPRWFVWENVPGVLSSGGGRDFGSFLGALAELGYGFAYRVLDAQYFGVAQRRRRVFVIGHLGDWQPAAEVLFESDCLRGNPAPRREAREVSAICPTLRAGGNRTGGDRPPGTDVDTADSLIVQPVGFDSYNHAVTGDVSKTLDVGQDYHHVPNVLQPVAFHPTQDPISSTDVCHSIGANENATAAVAFRENTRSEVEFYSGGVTGALTSGGGKPGQGYPAAMIGMQVRRLTPRECERLQGFPDDYTAIPWRKKPASECPDGPRYKALGNSMAVPVMAWIGKRIQEWEARQ